MTTISDTSYLDDTPSEFARLPYSFGAQFSTALKGVFIPVLLAAGFIQSAEYFYAQTPGQAQEIMYTVLISLGGLFLLVTLMGLLCVNKISGAQYIFNDDGILESGTLIEWSNIDHAEVYGEPRASDKASIVLYVDGDRELGLKIKRHDTRMKVSEAIRCHITNIAFKD